MLGSLGLPVRDTHAPYSFVDIVLHCLPGGLRDNNVRRGQVREVAPGTYRISVGGGAGSVVFGSHEAADAAVGQAGQYCHAKGQKLVIMPTTGHDVIFRCGEKTAPGE